MTIFNLVITMKRLLTILLLIIIIFLTGCSKEEKFGIDQFVVRINHEYNTQYKTSYFLSGKNSTEENCLFYEYGDYLLTLRMNDSNQIVGAGLLTTNGERLTEYISEFCRITSVLCGTEYNQQADILGSCGILAENIKMTDSNWMVTVGKYNYSVVCNSYSITLFCDRI